MKYKGIYKILVIIFCVTGLGFAIDGMRAFSAGVAVGFIGGVLPVILLYMFYFRDNLMGGAIFIFLFVLNRAEYIVGEGGLMWLKIAYITFAAFYIGVIGKLSYMKKEEDEKEGKFTNRRL